MNNSPHLDVIQRWMMSVISNPEGIVAGISSPKAQQEIAVVPEQINDVILPSHECSSVQRLAVYGNAYFARLIECLEGEFPAVRFLVGKDAFAGFVLTYLKESPPSSYTLADLGRRFPDSLSANRPPKANDDPAYDWADYLIEVAKLERLYSEVFDGPGDEQKDKLSAESLLSIPPEQLLNIQFEVTPSLRLIQFQFPVHEAITAVRKEKPVPPLHQQETYLAVHRVDFIVRRTVIDAPQFILLQELQQGTTLIDALSVLIEKVGEQSFSPAMLQNWFKNWTKYGYFLNVHLPE
ncbi:HvfC/BufC family peptide modification chaperone [Planctomicrobium sp. SH527]|uniref:HvfC/BufC family peptide modification chaperone n=1 Tax=Planctomicrobium sp. SH527 TaxID=3448123 RepID=UPI003F5B2B5E